MVPKINLFVHLVYICCSNEGKSAYNVVQAYLAGILTHKGGIITILTDNGIEFKNKVLYRANDQL